MKRWLWMAVMLASMTYGTALAAPATGVESTATLTGPVVSGRSVKLPA